MLIPNWNKPQPLFVRNRFDRHSPVRSSLGHRRDDGGMRPGFGQVARGLRALEQPINQGSAVPLPPLRLTRMQMGSATAAATASSRVLPANRSSARRKTIP